MPQPSSLLTCDAAPYTCPSSVWCMSWTAHLHRHPAYPCRSIKAFTESLLIPVWTAGAVICAVVYKQASPQAPDYLHHPDGNILSIPACLMPSLVLPGCTVTNCALGVSVEPQATVLIANNDLSFNQVAITMYGHGVVRDNVMWGNLSAAVDVPPPTEACGHCCLVRPASQLASSSHVHHPCSHTRRAQHHVGLIVCC